MTAHLEPRRAFPRAAPRLLHDLPLWPLNDESRAELELLFDIECDQAARVRAAHVDRLERVAFECGGKVARGEMLFADATARIAGLAFAPASDVPVPRYVLAPDLSEQIAAESYAAGARAARSA
jgi:hypothetical protein